MAVIRTVLSLVLFAFASVLVVGDAEAAGPPRSPNPTKRGAGAARAGKGKGGKKKNDALLVAELQAAHKVLAAADPIYHGHRAKAMKEINAAIGELQKEMHKRGLKDHTKHTANVPKNVSHEMVAKAGQSVRTIHGHISGMEPTTHRAKAAVHLAKADKEIVKALAQAKRKGAVAKK